MSNNHLSQQQLQKSIIRKMYRAMCANDLQSVTPDALHQSIGELAIRLINEHDGLTQNARDKVYRSIMQCMLGNAVVDEYLHDPEVTEIMVNGTTGIFVEKKGKLFQTSAKFDSDDDVLNFINRIVGNVGRRIDESSPLVDARLADGSRVNAIIPPVCLSGPTVTIRKFSKESFRLENLVELGTVTQSDAERISQAVIQKKNIIIAGGTGSGKTTTLNALVNSIPPDERIITIEDAAEIQTSHPHRIALESRPANIEGTGEITIRTLVRNALRMRPDRIIVGEIRGAECIDMLQAMNTGHKGSICTLHANSPIEALYRLETMGLMAKLDIPIEALRTQIASGIDVIMYQERCSDGRRRISSIVDGISLKENKYILTPINSNQSVE